MSGRLFFLVTVISLILVSLAIAAPSTSIFTGTMFTISAGDLETATNVTIESSDGIINFTTNVLNLSAVGNVDSDIVIQSGIVGIDTNDLPQLNASAIITMKNLGFSGTPQILFNDGLGNGTNTPCPVSLCSGISFTSGTLTFTAAHFTTFVVGEAIETITFDIPASVLIGDNGQRASNPAADEPPNRDATAQKDFTVSNEGSLGLSNLAITPLFNAGFSSDDLKLSFIFTQTTLSSGQDATITVSARIPEDLDAVNETTLKEQAFKVATLQITATADNGSLIIEEIPLLMQRENQLDIEDLDVCINGRCQNVDNSGDDIEFARPGDEIEIRILVENEFSDNDAEDIEIDDVTIRFDIDDDDLNEDGDENINTLDPQKDREEIFVFTLDEDLQAGSYDVLVTLDGTDEHSALHGDTIKFQLNVERKRRDIEIRKAQFNPSTLRCGVTRTTLETRVVNFGTKRELRAAIEYENKELNIKEKSSSFTLDEGADKILNFPIDLPKDIKPGEYRFSVTTFFEEAFASDREDIKFTVESCEDETTTTETAEESTQVSQDTIPRQENTRITSSLPEKSIFAKMMGSGAIWIIGVIMILIFLALFVALIKVL